MDNRKQQHLQNGAHFRVIRSMLRDLANQELINLSEYDCQNICVFKVCGYDYREKNVIFTNTYNNESCFVTDNLYEIIEVPYIHNQRSSCYGKFLTLAHNVTVYTDGTGADRYFLIKLNVLNNIVKIYVYGEYQLKYANTRNASFNKILDGYRCIDGHSHENDTYDTFDKLGLRKQFYQMRDEKKFVPDGRHFNVISNKPVKIYKKKLIKRKK